MAQNSSIEWTHHTFNPWWGCAKVSQACKYCYAETWAKRVGEKVWGGKAPRRFFGEKHWAEPVRWNVQAEAEGERKRVFCASMADVFERRAELNKTRQRLWELIARTPMLDWLLLTKRPQNIATMAPWSGSDWPANVWLGTTVETQAWAEKRLAHLLDHAAAVRFLSCEPLLGELKLGRWLSGRRRQGVDWVIAGGESGPKSRIMKPAWVRSLRDQCLAAGVPFHFKQWGHWIPAELFEGEKAGKLAEVDGEPMLAVGKKGAGRKLDGDFWDGLPLVFAGER